MDTVEANLCDPDRIVGGRRFVCPSKADSVETFACTGSEHFSPDLALSCSCACHRDEAPLPLTEAIAAFREEEARRAEERRRRRKGELRVLCMQALLMRNGPSDLFTGAAFPDDARYREVRAGAAKKLAEAADLAAEALVSMEDA